MIAIIVVQVEHWTTTELSVKINLKYQVSQTIRRAGEKLARTVLICDACIDANFFQRFIVKIMLFDDLIGEANKPFGKLLIGMS